MFQLDFPSHTGLASETLEALFASERPRLVRFCSRLTGNPDVAEDLAQETLIEAWRNLHKFAIPDLAMQSPRWSKWIAAIARNICKRWARSYYSERSHLTLVAQYHDDEATETSLEDLPTDDDDIELELERDELAQLLDRALALLPPAVREVLIERYLHESSHAEIAERLGLSEDALVQRLYRGKLALRSVITTQMREEATTYGIALTSDTDHLQQATRIWCPFCGKGRLIRYTDPTKEREGFTCPQCGPITVLPRSFSEGWSDISLPKPILSRQLDQIGRYYWQAINTQQGICLRCGDTVQERSRDHLQAISLEGGVLPYFPYKVVFLDCAHCGNQERNGLPHLSLDTPEAQQFWRKHPRMQWLPAREIEYAGHSAFISSFQSMTDAAQLDIILQHATLKALAIHESTP